MRRLLISNTAAVEKSIDEFVGKPKKPRAPNKAKVREQLREMLVSNDFGAATASHLVALYEWCHEQVYGARPSEMDAGDAWKLATFSAARLVKDEFNGDFQRAIEFVRWTWQREKAREQARRTGRNSSVGRIGWRLQFVTRHLVTDYRIDMARAR